MLQKYAKSIKNLTKMKNNGLHLVFGIVKEYSRIAILVTNPVTWAIAING